MEIENFIRTYDALPHDFCNRVVNLFEANIDKASPGKTLTGIEDHKVSLDIEISQAEHIDLWRDIDKEFHKSVGDIVGQYMNEFAECFAKTTQMIGDVGYAVRKYQQGTGFFGLHSDVNGLKSNHRMLAVIWYLNTVSEGGEPWMNLGGHKYMVPYTFSDCVYRPNRKSSLMWGYFQEEEKRGSVK